MNFSYSGENAWMDHLGTTGGSFIIFNNSSPFYRNGIAYDGSTYKTVGTSFEFGGLQDASPPSTKKALADSIMRFFGITPVQEEMPERKNQVVFSLSKSRPNPFCNTVSFTYGIPLREGKDYPGKQLVSISIFDVTGRRIRTLVHDRKEPGYYTALWDGDDDYGKNVSQGVYFIRLILEDEGQFKTRKTVLLR
jgi:hypothetical protein